MSSMSRYPRDSGLHIERITKTYGKNGNRANNEISVNVRAGEVTAVIGHNGAGKSTLLNQILGVVRPDKGDIRYGETSLVQHPSRARRLCSAMPQLHAPLNGVTPRQAITATKMIRGGGDVDRIIDALDIEKWENTPGEKLSGGLRRLTSFAMATVRSCPIILVDEPTNDVDPVRRPLVWRRLREIADEGAVVLVVSHNLAEVEDYADRFLLLQHGELIEDGSPNLLADYTGTDEMRVLIKDPDVTLPAGLDFSREGNMVRFTLSSSQAHDAVHWAISARDRGELSRIEFAPLSLDNYYESVTTRAS